MLPADQRPPLTPVREEGREVADNIDVQVNWETQQVTARQAALTRRATDRSNQGSSRVPTEHSTYTGPNTQNLPVMNFHDEFNNRAQAIPDGIGGWTVKFTRFVSLGMAERTQVATVLKGIAFSLVLSGEAAKQSGEPAGQSAKTAGNVVTGFTQLADVANYGSSAWKTARNEGLRAAFSDLRKTALQLASMGAVVAAAIYQKGENPIANAAAAGMSMLGALSATGPSHQEKTAQQKDREVHFLGNPAALESRTDLTALGLESQSTGLSVLTPSARTGTAPTYTQGSASSSIRSAPHVADLMPLTRMNTSGSGSSAKKSAVPGVGDVPRVRRGKG